MADDVNGGVLGAVDWRGAQPRHPVAEATPLAWRSPETAEHEDVGDLVRLLGDAGDAAPGLPRPAEIRWIGGR